MPTPSNGTSSTPLEIPSRTHGSSCPDDVRPPSSRRPDNDDGLVMNVGGDETMSPEVISTSATANVETATVSQSDTESPRSESRIDVHNSGSEPSSVDSPPHKPNEELPAAQDGVEVSATEPHCPKCGIDATIAEQDKPDEEEEQTVINQHEDEPSMGFDYSNFRVFPTSPSSFLRPRSRFFGTQQSERQVYDVHVEIKYVDLRESFLCGYLKIEGLTKDNPTLTTYFEGEIIGSRYDFWTKHEGWGATEKIDMNHWGKFSAFRPYSKQVRKGVAVPIPNLAQRENIFMRWKEQFVVPDHRVTTLNGASFEGFYYICYNQREGSISGIYFHRRSEKFQQLELKHVEDRGCYSAFEFR
ncbi:vacuolar import and degradation protein-domain-containing protein [Xylaria intraflava]|nr:vacuolar import and degradation protein-domain-containing protein [Xylaria intraflava]